jgi:type I restriction enzyme R subunit
LSSAARSEQFAASPDLANEIMNAVMDALTAHTAMSKQALESAKLREDMKDVLLGAGKLWEELRAKSAGVSSHP